MKVHSNVFIFEAAQFDESKVLDLISNFKIDRIITDLDNDRIEKFTNELILLESFPLLSKFHSHENFMDQIKQCSKIYVMKKLTKNKEMKESLKQLETQDV